MYTLQHPITKELAAIDIRSYCDGCSESALVVYVMDEQDGPIMGSDERMERLIEYYRTYGSFLDADSVEIDNFAEYEVVPVTIG